MGEMHALMLVREAEFQAREHQEGVDASKGHLSVASNMGMTGDNLSVVSAFRAPEPNGKAQYVTTLIRDNHRYSLWMETRGHFYCGTGGGSQSLHLGDLAAGTDHLVALCRDGGTLYCYLDGELKGTLGVYDFVAADGFSVGRAAINKDTLFTSTIYGAKVFNYALSAAEVSALYNNGDPAGYVLPAEMKSGERRCLAEYLPQNLVESPHGDPVEIVGENSYTWTGADDSVYAKILDTSRPSVYRVAYKINVTVSNYEAGAPYLSVTGGYGSVNIPAKNGTFDVIALCDDNRSHVFAYYGGYQNTDRRLTITINSIEPVPGVASSWLDSAKHLPLNDEYLPPLLESINGYDLAANGTPEIIYK